MIQKLLDRDRVAARVARMRKAQKRINLCIWCQLLRIIQGLNRRFKEYLATAREQKAIGWLCGAIASFRPRVRSGKLGDTVFSDRQLCRTGSIGLHERLHQVVEPGEGWNRGARDRPFSAQRNIVFGEDGRIAGVAASPAALDADRVEASGFLLVEFRLIVR